MEVARPARVSRWRRVALILLAALALAAALGYVPARSAFFLGWHAQHHAPAQQQQQHPALRWIPMPEMSARYRGVRERLDGLHSAAGAALLDARRLAEAAGRLTAALDSHDHGALRRAAADLEQHAATLQETRERLASLQQELELERARLADAWQRRWPGSALAQTAALEVQGSTPPPDPRQLGQARTQLAAARSGLEQHGAGQLDRVAFFTGSSIEQINFAELSLPAQRHGTRRVEAAMAQLRLVGFALGTLDSAAAALGAAESALAAAAPADAAAAP